MSDFPLPHDWQSDWQSDWQTLAAGYVLGDLSSEEMAQFQQLLVAHPQLTQIVADLQETLSMLPYGLPQQPPDKQVRTRLMSAAKTQLSPSLPLRQPTGPASRLRWVARLAASVAVILGGCSLWLTYRVATLQARLASAERFAEIAIADEAVPGPALTISPAEPLLAQEWAGLSQLVQDHLGSLVRSQGPVDIATADPDALLAQLARAEPIPTLTSPQAKLLGGSPCQFGKAQGLRLTYQLPSEQTVSVYQIDLNGNQFPQFSETHVTLRDRDTNLIFWREQDYLYALAADLPLTDLQTLAQTL
ncbi:MAG: hypothetical protein AAF152_17575 [Cyanobacteria bacterium P01_A01_bin.114]